MIETQERSPSHESSSVQNHPDALIAPALTHEVATGAETVVTPTLSHVAQTRSELEDQVAKLRTQEAQLRDIERPLHPGLMQQDMTFRQKVLSIFGNAFDVYDADGERKLHASQDRFKLKEKIHVYPNKMKRDEEELLTIKARERLDLWSTFDVYDPQHKEAVGALKREWLKSGLQDTWTFLSPEGKPIGQMTESRPRRAIMSRIFGMVIAPQRYTVFAPDGEEVAKVKQWRNPIARKYDMKVLQEHPAIDRRLLVTAGILLASVEANQPSSPAEGWTGSIVDSANNS
ncbi:MAG: hypothetical protein HY430_00615 [Candidatus Levybacteria bacterium]|nr:hypothetical protein [Candidatus Levybacteria bacterium]